MSGFWQEHGLDIFGGGTYLLTAILIWWEREQLQISPGSHVRQNR